MNIIYLQNRVYELNLKYLLTLCTQTVSSDYCQVASVFFKQLLSILCLFIGHIKYYKCNVIFYVKCALQFYIYIYFIEVSNYGMRCSIF